MHACCCYKRGVCLAGIPRSHRALTACTREGIPRGAARARVPLGAGIAGPWVCLCLSPLLPTPCSEYVVPLGAGIAGPPARCIPPACARRRSRPGGPAILSTSRVSKQGQHAGTDGRRPGHPVQPAQPAHAHAHAHTHARTQPGAAAAPAGPPHHRSTERGGRCRRRRRTLDAPARTRGTGRSLTERVLLCSRTEQHPRRASGWTYWRRRPRQRPREVTRRRDGARAGTAHRRTASCCTRPADSVSCAPGPRPLPAPSMPRRHVSWTVCPPRRSGQAGEADTHRFLATPAGPGKPRQTAAKSLLARRQGRGT